MSAALEPALPPALGRYEVVGHLATGGMAEILLGRVVGESGFERPVVLKRILPHLARTQAFVDMFLDEARIVARIRHPNVVSVHELGRAAGELFLVMEYVEGESVGGLMRRLWTRNEDLGYALSAYVVAQACAGLHAAHELRDDDGRALELVHRDVSPHNVMVTYGGEVKVLDFGIAKAADRITRTEAGQVKGKFEYMSPEQCRGKSLDRRSDVFALGTLLFELSTSRRLYKRTHEMATLKAICDEAPASPSRLVEGYPGSMERICRKALAKRPDDRYPTAAAMRRDLLDALRELGGTSAHEEATAELMRHLFADRIEVKAEMLRRFRAGATLTAVPAAETDGAVEIPIFFDDDGTALTLKRAADVSMVTRTPYHRRRASRGRALVIGAGVVALAGLAVVAVRGGASPTEAPAPAAPSETAAVVEPAPAPARVLVRIETSPAGAQVRVAGADRGTTPLDLELPRGSEPVVAEIRQEGFDTLQQRLVPDVDQRLVLTLERAPAAATPGARPRPGAARPPAPRKPSPSASPSAAPSAPKFWRFD